MKVQNENMEWDTIYSSKHGTIYLDTERNYQNQRRVFSEMSNNWRNFSCEKKTALIFYLIAIGTGLAAIGDSHSRNKPCENACIVESVVCGISGLLAIIFSCISCWK